jgi:alpha-D-xyloside xylohydrolase
MPYIYKNAITASKEGIPVMRSMVLEFTDDKTCHYLDKQYMFGDSLLVAPIFNDEGLAEYYLPNGVWTNYFTGKEYKGGTWVSETHDYMSIPLMVRENSIVVTGAHDDKPDYDYADGCELRVYAIHDGVNLETVVYGMNNLAELNVSVKRQGHTIHITAEGDKPYTIRMINMNASNAVNGFLTIDGNDSVVTPDSGARMIEINF